MKKNEFKSSIDLDEYSKHGRRFMNINLHFNGGFINLGLEKIKGSFKSNGCLELLT